MAGDVHCQRFVYPTDSGNLFEIGVHALIGDYGKKNASFFTERVVGILIGNGSCRFQIRYATNVLRFLTCLVNPVVAFIINGYMLRFQALDIRKRQSGQRAEHEYVTDNIQPLKSECLVHYGGELIFGKELAIGRLSLNPHALEQIDLHPFVIKRQCYDSFQYLALLVCSVLFLLFINAEKKMKVTDEGIVDREEWNIICVITLTDELTEITLCSLVAKNSVKYNISEILQVVLFEYFAQHFGLLNSAVPFVKNGLRVDNLLSLVKR